MRTIFMSMYTTSLIIASFLLIFSTVKILEALAQSVGYLIFYQKCTRTSILSQWIKKMFRLNSD